VNGRFLRVSEFKHTIGIFKGSKGVARATKFKQKTAKIALISVLCIIRTILPVNSRFFGVHELKYTYYPIFQGAKGVAMTTKFRQKVPKLHMF